MLATVGCASQPSPNPPAQNAPGETPPSQPPPAQGGQTPTVVSQEEAQKIAINFLKNAPTFRFDGMAETLKLVGSGPGKSTSSWVFHYEFQSRQAGYGDRTGRILAQVITDHKAEIEVEEGKVVSAVLDGRWDELNQRAK